MALASGGGHWIQLQRIRGALDGFDVAFASTFPEYSKNVEPHRYYSFPDVSRKSKHQLPALILRLAFILLRERPRVVITTGSFPGLVTIALAKTFLRARTIWIDSIANCERLSTSGSKARRFADVYLTQWPQLASERGPHFWGAVL